MLCDVHATAIPQPATNNTTLNTSLQNCDSLFCEDKCAFDSIYCVTHTCFPDQITYNTEYIEEQKKIEKQIEEQKRIGTTRKQKRIGTTRKQSTFPLDYTPAKSGSDTLSRLSSPIGYVTSDEFNSYSLYDKHNYQTDIENSKRQYEYSDVGPQYSLYDAPGVSTLLDINRTCIWPDCKKSSLFYGKVCVSHKCLYCHESAVRHINICLFHMPPSLIHCVSHNINRSEFLPQCYLAKLPSNVLIIIVDIIRNNFEKNIGYFGID
jgi:hypothetical protein